jgi:predicted RNA-binding Zn-ribbon protein involved in translation (DUF1610 family)
MKNNVITHVSVLGCDEAAALYEPPLCGTVMISRDHRDQNDPHEKASRCAMLFDGR